jgi:S-adenosylmethionine-dependent methyltransferase
MTTTGTDWDNTIDKWRESQNFPWGKLIYTISQYNIQRHLDDKPKRILDIGGGNGANSMYYAKQGHYVTCLDYSPAMLAEAKETAKKQGVSKNITFFQGDADDIHERLHGQQFDFILCHLMLEFSKNPQALLRNICKLITPGGIFSILDSNRFAEVYRKLFQASDLVAALGEIGTKEYPHPWFDQRKSLLFSGEEIIDILQNNGCKLVGHYGVRCVCDYVPNERKFEAEYYNSLETLELKLTDTYPYYLLARMYQVIARKK